MSETKGKSDGRHRQRMRVQGYEDGIKGKPAKHVDAEYQRSHRRGQERAAELKGKME